MGNLQKIFAVAGAVAVIAGLAGVAYPFVGAYVNSITHKHAVESYDSGVQGMDPDDTARMLEQAAAYNEFVAGRGDTVADLDEDEYASYLDTLSVSSSGMIGYIRIPAIDVTLPIYHGTDEDVLQMGVGHVAGSSFPIGGEGTAHTVLAGHSGLPSKKLFTDLDLLEPGDLFSVMVLDCTSVYEVDSVKVVLPEEAEHLPFEEGADLCTLITCTPIGVNTHRLVVSARRIQGEDAEQWMSEAEADDTRFVPLRDSERKWYAVIVIVWIVLLSMGIVFFLRAWRKR